MKTSVLAILNKFDELYVDPECELVFSSDYELLVAVILSAQCTDKRVNEVTAKLFKDYNTAEKMITLSQEELETRIRPCGFFHNKAKHILEMSKDLVQKHEGRVPSKKEELKALAGVGEKTANVVLSLAFKIPAIAVDTHVFRVSNRVGLAKGKTVSKVQTDLEKNLPKDKWIKMHYALVLHGRYICKPQRPLCEKCELSELCKFYKNKK